ncbi:MAG: xanthine dehydrogenase small subunit [Planctomycetota bacterium]|jgi:xanthine dehydrogenase small subunit
MIRFLLNDRSVDVARPAGELLLDTLRGPLTMTGVKQGCREGDCGACTILVGKLEGGELRYRAVPSCMMLLAQAQGSHIVTVEGINHASELTPVQCAVAEEGGTQCGFCTPGVVLSLTSTLCAEPDATEPELLESVGGNICRCTGYMSFRRTARRLASAFEVRPKGSAERIQSLVQAKVLPPYFTGVAQRLEDLQEDLGPLQTDSEKADYGIAGGTDVLVQRRTATEIAAPHFFQRPADMDPIALEGDWCRMDASTTFEELKRSAIYRERDPKAVHHMELVASQLIRERATIAGNIANASPIADIVICLLALGAELDLRGPSGSRSLALSDYYLDYKQTALLEGESIVCVRLPLGRQLRNFEKVSRRERLDIATVNSAASFEIEEGCFRRVLISAGGVGPIPLLLKKAMAFLEGAQATPAKVGAALTIVEKEVTPISDVRGSADYKSLLLKQLVLAHFIEELPDIGFEELAL